MSMEDQAHWVPRWTRLDNTARQWDQPALELARAVSLRLHLHCCLQYLIVNTVIYGYDYLKRAIQINRFPAGASVPDVCQSTSLKYDFPALRDDGATQVIPNNGSTNYMWGRLTGAAFGDVNLCGFGRIYEAYGYTQPGQVSQKRLMVERGGNPKPAGALDAAILAVGTGTRILAVIQ